MSHRRKHRLKLKSLYVWHRYVGLVTAIFVLLLASSGIALNHTEGFALDQRFVQARWLLNWYGIQAPESGSSTETPHGRLTLLGTKLYFNTRPLEGNYERLYGAVAADGLLMVAVDHDLLLLTARGEYVERLSKGDGSPGAIDGVGLDAGARLIVRTDTGLYHADGQLLDWQPWSGTSDSVTWSTSHRVAGSELWKIQSDYLGRVLPWERVILDLHSGRLLGLFGPWLMDAAAILMLFLAGSGVFIWWKRQR